LLTALGVFDAPKVPGDRYDMIWTVSNGELTASVQPPACNDAAGTFQLVQTGSTVSNPGLASEGPRADGSDGHAHDAQHVGDVHQEQAAHAAAHDEAHHEVQTGDAKPGKTIAGNFITPFGTKKGTRIADLSDAEVMKGIAWCEKNKKYPEWLENAKRFVKDPFADIFEAAGIPVTEIGKGVK